MGKADHGNRSVGAAFGKPDATGRSSGKHGSKTVKNLRPPKGATWAWLTADLLASPAWRAQSINCRRLIDALMLENCRHAGQENGSLVLPYDALQSYGLTRENIKPSIIEAASLGLIRVDFGGRYAGRNTPNVYSLTFLGRLTGTPPDDWQAITDDQIARIKPGRRGQPVVRKAALRDASDACSENADPGSETRTTVIRKAELPTPIRATGTAEKPVRKSELLSRYTGPPPANGTDPDQTLAERVARLTGLSNIEMTPENIVAAMSASTRKRLTAALQAGLLPEGELVREAIAAATMKGQA